MVKIPITRAQSDLICRRRADQTGGGFQRLFFRLQGGIGPGNATAPLSLTMTEADARRVLSYARAYGQGGWQDALKSILPSVRAALKEIEQPSLALEDSNAHS